MDTVNFYKHIKRAILTANKNNSIVCVINRHIHVMTFEDIVRYIHMNHVNIKPVDETKYLPIIYKETFKASPESTTWSELTILCKVPIF